MWSSLSKDPFPRVAGGGIAELDAAGIEVEVGLLRDEARRLNAPYLKLTQSGRPWLIAKWAMTLDGKIATHTGRQPLDLVAGIAADRASACADGWMRSWSVEGPPGRRSAAHRTTAGSSHRKPNRGRHHGIAAADQHNWYAPRTKCR